MFHVGTNRSNMVCSGQKLSWMLQPSSFECTSMMQLLTNQSAALLDPQGCVSPSDGVFQRMLVLQTANSNFVEVTQPC